MRVPYRPFTWLLLLIIGLATRPLLADEAKEGFVAATLLCDRASIQAGKPFDVGVLLKIKPGWHVYWKNPGDSGIATSIEFKLPEGFSVGELQFPVPERIDAPGGLVNYGYTNEVMLLATVTPPKELSRNTPVHLAAHVDWLVCEETCIPGNADFAVDLPVSDHAQPANEEVFHEWSDRLPTALNDDQVKLRHVRSKDGTLVMVSVATPDGARDVQWFPPANDASTIKDVKVEPGGRSVAISFLLATPDGQKPSDEPMDSVLAYKTADGKKSGVRVPIRWNR
jgi:DsbC/DsbD-like thiol-disulfide interchange protein